MSEEYYDYEPSSEQRRISELTQEVANLQFQNQQLQNVKILNGKTLDVCQQRINQLSNNVDNLTRQLAGQNVEFGRSIQSINDRIKKNTEQTNSRMRELTNNLNKKMEEQRQNVKNYVDSTSRRLENIIDQSNKDLRQKIQNTEQILRNDMATMRNDINRKFAEVRHQIEEMSQRVTELERDKYKRDEWRRRVVKMAEEYYTQANILRTNIKDGQKFPHAESLFKEDMEKLDGMFERYDRYRRQIRVDENEVDRNFREESIQLLDEALQLYYKVCEAEQRWQEEKLDTQNILHMVKGHLIASRIINDRGYEIDTNFWTVGSLESLDIFLKKLHENLEKDNINFDSFQLFKDAALQIDKDIDSTVKNATLAFLCSQEREEIAENIKNAYYEQGYEQEDEAVHEDEKRGDYVMTLQDECMQDIEFKIHSEGEITKKTLVQGFPEVKIFEVKEQCKIQGTMPNGDRVQCDKLKQNLTNAVEKQKMKSRRQMQNKK